MADEKRENIKFLATLVTALCGIVLVPINAWALNKLIDQGERLARVETWIGDGARYTSDDADRDIGILADLLRRQGLTLDDHEARIRKIELAE